MRKFKINLLTFSTLQHCVLSINFDTTDKLLLINYLICSEYLDNNIIDQSGYKFGEIVVKHMLFDATFVMQRKEAEESPKFGKKPAILRILRAIYIVRLCTREVIL